MIRSRSYSLDGRFQHSPMMIDSEDSLEGRRASLKSTPKLRTLIKKAGELTSRQHLLISRLESRDHR